MVLAPFFFALGAFGGGLFVASPCVMGVVVCRGVCRRERCAVAVAFVCGPARAARRWCGNVRRRGVLCASVREGCGGGRRVF